MQQIFTAGCYQDIFLFPNLSIHSVIFFHELEYNQFYLQVVLKKNEF